MANVNGFKMVTDFWDSETIMKTYILAPHAQKWGWLVYTTQMNRGCPTCKTYIYLRSC